MIVKRSFGRRATSVRMAYAGIALMLASLLYGGQNAWSQESPKQNAPGVDVVRLDQIVQYYVDNGSFMGSVLVARGDKLLLSKGYGWADLEWRIPNSPATKFRLGSITKQFTAAAIMLLVEQGKLALDDRVSVHMPNAPAAWHAITIRNLLTHTSGIPNFTSLPGYATWKLSPTTPEQIIAHFRDLPLEFPPGQRMSYSNSNYIVLGYLIERLSGESYADFLRKHIFTPLGVKDSGYDSNTAIIPMRASGYSPSANGPVNAPYVNMTIPFAAGGLYSTTGDLLRWTQGLFGGKLLSAKSLKAMTTPFLNDYAFGLVVRTVDGRKIIEHNGGIAGFNTDLAYYPEDKVTVTALGNLNGAAPQEIVRQLGAAVHGEPVTLPSERKAIELPVGVLDDYPGRYELRPGFDLVITLEDGHLMSQATGQPKVEIYPEAKDRFFLKAVDAQIDFVRGEDGKVQALVLHQAGQSLRAERR